MIIDLIGYGRLQKLALANFLFDLCHKKLYFMIVIT